MKNQGTEEPGEGGRKKKIDPEGHRDSLSKERIVRRVLFSRADPLESAVRGHYEPGFEPAAKLLHSSPAVLGTLPPPTWMLSQIAPRRVSETRKG
jgi:hypothetical protein